MHMRGLRGVAFPSSLSPPSPFRYICGGTAQGENCCRARSFGCGRTENVVDPDGCISMPELMLS